MKTRIDRLVIALVTVLFTATLPAAVKYWDLNGDAVGAGGASPAGTWDTSTSNWTLDPTGSSATTAFTAGDAAVFSAGTDATGTYTVTVSGTPNPVAITNKNGKVNIAGSQINMVGAGAAMVKVETGATLSVGSSTAFLLATNAGSTLILDGGTFENRLTGNAGNFFGTGTSSTFLINVTTNGGILRFNTANIMCIVQTGTPGMIISGPGGITKTGQGVLAIASANTYTGPTIINEGEIRIRTSANRLPTGTAVTVNAPGILNLNGVAQQIGSLAGDGDVGLSGATLTIGGTANTAFSGVIKTTANAGAGGSSATGGNVTKQGTGVLTLTGPNDFTGLLTLTAGGINVSSSGVLCNPICDVAVNGGVLSLSNATQTIENLYGTGGTIILNDGHTLTLDAVNTSVARVPNYFGAVTGSGNLIKTGSLTQRLFGANSYTGSTAVNVGELVLTTASTGAGSFTANDYAGLGARVASPGSSLNMSELTLNYSTMGFDFADLGDPTAPIVNVAGPLNINNLVAVNVRGFDTTNSTSTTLLQYGSGQRTGGGAFVTGMLPPRAIGIVNDDTINNRVTLDITATDSLIWVGDVSGDWDVNNMANFTWKLASDGTATYYQQNAVDGDTVRFDDSATGASTVNFVGDLSPFKVTVDNGTQDYRFGGSGRFAGLSKLVKSGNGQLTITNANELIGGVELNAGTINVGNNSALGTTSGRLTIHGGAIRSDGTTARTITVPTTLAGDVALGDPVQSGVLTFSTSPWAVSGTRQITVADGSVRSVISSAISGAGGLVKAGDGILDLTGANAFTGGLSHNGGTIRVNGSTGLGAANSTVNLADGVTLATTSTTARTLTYVFDVNGDVSLGQVTGGTAALTLAGWMNLGGANRTFTTITNGGISATVTNGGITKMGAATLTLSGTNLYAGDTTNRQGAINPGTTSPSPFGVGGTVRFEGGNLVTSGGRTNLPILNSIVISTDTTFEGSTTGAGFRDFPIHGPISITAGTLTLKNAGTATGIWNTRLHAGGLNLDRPIVLGLSGDPGQVRLSSMNTNGGGDQTFAGEISGYGSFHRANNTAAAGGKTILSAANTYTGGTVVNDGVLLVNNVTGSGTGSGLVAAYANGVLGGSGTISGEVVVTNRGTISGGESAGTLSLGNGLNLADGGTNLWELAANTTDGAGASFDQIALTGGDLVLGGTSRLLVKFIGSATLPDSSNAFWTQTNTWKIIDLTGSAANPGLTTFAGVDGAEANTAGTFSTWSDASGVYLTFTPGVQAPPPEIDPSVLGAGTGNAQLSWSTVAGATYGVQYKTNLSQTGWLFLTNLTATGTSTTITDTTSPSPGERYYRVVSPWPQSP